MRSYNKELDSSVSIDVMRFANWLVEKGYLEPTRRLVALEDEWIVSGRGEFGHEIGF